MFSIEMLPGGRGDALWIEYGSPEAPNRVLIDGGTPDTYESGLGARINRLPEQGRQFELLVVTHIDLDHIGGILEVLRDPPVGFGVGDVWFNAYQHLNPGVRGPKQGEGLSAHLEESGYTWNEAFDGGPVSIGDDPEAELPSRTLPGGLKLTLLGPTQERLRKLEPEWRKVIEAAGLVPGQAGYILEEMEAADVRAPARIQSLEELANAMPKDDTSKANGSSIALLAEYDGIRCMFTGDAYSADMLKSAERLAGEGSDSPLELNALKLSHHGGAKNTHNELIQKLACPTFLFSTDSSYYGHPNDASVARVVVHGRRRGTPRLLFNHRPDEPRFWDDPDRLAGFPASLEYPEPGELGLRLEL